ncbi:MAG TPA: RIP metalloprotease RseP [Burkholderiales bacterium]|nr:RIP metalloprotease RseP [Burkholderiales bacterium]
MNLLHTLASFVVALGILIVVHEYGHYLAARICNVKVLRFSVGFGRPLLVWQRGRDATEWILAAVPFGGYVKMLDEREGPVAPAERERAFNRQNVWRRIFIVVAGPVFNLLFAIAVYTGLFLYGLPEPRPIVGEPAAGTFAHAAGLRAGDTVHSVGGEPIATWQELRWRVIQGALQRESLLLEVSNEREAITQRKLDLSSFPAADFEGDALERIGLRLYRPPLEPVFGTIVPGSPAERAGLKAGDRVVEAGGKAIVYWEELVQAIRARPGAPLRLSIERNGTRVALEVVPDTANVGSVQIGRIGAAPRVPESHADRILVKVNYGPLGALAKACSKTADIALFSLKMLGRMLIGEVSWKHLSGPVTIADYAGQSAQMGWLSYVTFLALISISLAVLNLLPIPLLDGGHLLYYAVEIIRGSPVSERAMELGQRVGLALLLLMMAFAFYNDLNRLFSG